MPEAALHAVIIGVPETAGHDDLPFARELTTELAAALEGLGYRTTLHTGSSPGHHVQSALAASGPADLLLVHVLGHGQPGSSDALYLLGDDGKPHPDADIGTWLRQQEDLPDRPLTLFLLDLCYAGAMARLPWQTRLAQGQARGWVIAACQGDQAAFDGRFTRAFAAVLRQLAKGRLGIDASVRHLPSAMLGWAVRSEVMRLTGDDERQDITGSLIDFITSYDLPFFPNPAYEPTDVGRALRRGIDPGTVPFLDEGLDIWHFMDRASGGPLSGELAGMFTGRKRELKQLSDWLRRFSPGRLTVLTGCAGSGKSALLGLLVCAAHPDLREPTRPLWEHVADAPDPVTRGFAAVHARQRSLPKVVASISRQLRLGELGTVPELLEAMRGTEVIPTILVDALDEAEAGVELMTALLLPLATDGLARVLVGVRRYDEYGPLIEEAGRDGFVLDLDLVPRRDLENDLFHYVAGLLRSTERYGDRRHGSVLGGFASHVSGALSSPMRSREWGEFLVARIYTRYFADLDEVIVDPREAERLGKEVPSGLPEVFELDLTARDRTAWTRRVLTALARTHGEGMPISVLARLAGSAVERVGEALTSGRSYLRQSVDQDGATLYRLFHQGLADHLQSEDGGALLDLLLAPLGPAGDRDWSAAEPYLLRHALAHAAEEGREQELLADTGFLIQAPPDVLEPYVDPVGLAAVLNATSGEPELVRRRAVALTAVRAGRPSEGAWRTAMTWAPVWSRRRDPGPPVQEEPSTRFPVSEPALALAVEGALLVSGHADGNLVTWDLATGTAQHIVESAHEGPVTALALARRGERPLVVSGGADGRIRFWNVTTLAVEGMLTADEPVRSLAAASVGDRLVVVSCGSEGTLWDAETGLRIQLPGHGKGMTAVAIGTLSGRLVAVTGARDGGVRVWDLDTHELVRGPLMTYSGTINTLDVTELHGRPIVVTGSADGGIRAWDMEAGAQVAAVAIVGSSPLISLRVVRPGGRQVVAAGYADGTLRSWDLMSGRQLGALGGDGGPVYAVTTSGIADRFVAVGGDHTIRIHDLGAGGGRPVNLVWPEQGCVVTATPGGDVHVADLATGEIRSVFTPPAAVETARLVVVGGHPMLGMRLADGSDLLWAPLAGSLIPAGTTLPEAPRRLLVVRRGGLATVELLGDAVGLADPGTGEGLAALVYAHAGHVTAFAAGQTGGWSFVLTGDDDGWVVVWDVDDWRPVDALYVGDPVTDVAAGSGYIIVGTADEVVAFV